MSYRKIERIFKNDRTHWVGNGFKVKQYFPTGQDREFFDRFSPFILMDYNAPCEFKGSNSRVGVDIHPHRGFETVTFALQGKVEHKDSAGNSGVIEPGDIQWMTAGSGILHKEFHEINYAKNDRIFHMIQLWVNLPKKDKMTPPKYQAITKDQMGLHQLPNGEIIVYAGEVLGTKGPANTFSPINIYKINLPKGESVEIQEPASHNTGMLMIQGKSTINNKENVQTDDFILFENDGNAYRITAQEDSEIFVLSGEPLNEPVVAYGPFVMNTMEEIYQANIDMQNGKFGSFDF